MRKCLKRRERSKYQKQENIDILENKICIWYMAFNTEGDGFPIALIKIDDKKDKIVYLDENSGAMSNYTQMKLNQGRFQYQFNTSKERFISYVVGQSGSGKSYWTAQIAQEYKKLYPKRDIFLLSYVNEDQSIDKVKGIKRINLGEEFLSAELSSEDFKDSLVIFDDCDCITDKKMKLKIKDILTKILQTGRHTKTSCIYLSHIACGGIDTKVILNEAHSITFFPATMTGRTKDYLLKNYLGLNKKQQQKLESIENDTRSVTIAKTYPSVIITDKDLIVTKTL